MRGKNHTDESKALMSEAKIGINHPMFGKNTSEQTRVKISEAKGSAIKVTDLETNVEENVFSIRKAAELLRVDHSNLSKRFKGSNCFILNGRYKIEKL
jgi:group I intron endonuclease